MILFWIVLASLCGGVLPAFLAATLALTVLARFADRMVAFAMGDRAIEHELHHYFNNYFTIKLDHLKIKTQLLGDDAQPRLETVFDMRKTA